MMGIIAAAAAVLLRARAASLARQAAAQATFQTSLRIVEVRARVLERALLHLNLTLRSDNR